MGRSHTMPALKFHGLALVCLLAVTILAQSGAAMWQDKFDDVSAWSMTYGDNKPAVSGIEIVDGRCLRIPADFRNVTSNRVSRAINLPRPRWVSFKLKTGADVPADRLKLRLRLESLDCPLDFICRLKHADGEWAEFEADINSPLSLVNVWRFYGLRRLTRLSLIIESPPGDSAFDIFFSDLKFHYGEDIVEEYRPRQIELRPTDPPSIAVCMNTAGEYYGVEELLKERFPDAKLSIHAFRGLHLPVDNWPSDLSRASLVIMVDADMMALSDRELAGLADYVHSGGSLLVFAGPNSVSASLDGRPPAVEILPAQPDEPIEVRSESALSGPLGSGLPFAGQLQAVKPKRGASVLLSDGEGRPVIVSGAFGQGKVALIACRPDASRDRGRSIFWSPEYGRLVASVISQISGMKAVNIERVLPTEPRLRIEFPYHKRVFTPGGEIEFAVIAAAEIAGSNIRCSLTDAAGEKVWNAAGALDEHGQLTVRDRLPDLADGAYVLSVTSGDGESASTEVAIAPPLNLQSFYPIIARLPVQQGRHWYGPKTLKWMVEDAAAHGANTIAVPVLDAIAKDPRGFEAETAGFQEL